MSQALLIQLGGVALDVALKDEPEKTKNLYLAALAEQNHPNFSAHTPAMKRGSIT